ncbi:BlaI/MecI/CopY family transcriptional regulator [Nigerium massiliense]|uniref:BlaI/MecI/CopY family transcriptional regulator n=1 Tax=Nigerium massiliense TaxID=1522317 RepID=UPI0006944832|nr:BlaI/MecI/CopY family transcriptional regulator [Nigerium massiliense]
MALLGELEHQVMTVLWHRTSAASVREVHDELSAHRELAYTTVMTVLDRLAKKGIALRELDGRAWFYRPAMSCVDLHADEIVALLDSCGPDSRAEIWARVSEKLQR